jgi:hypothetical protein
MSSVLERQMEELQNRVQQKINLAEDEIQRLSNRLPLKTTQLNQEQKVREIRSQANTDVAISRLRADHHVFMQELQERHNQEVITSLHGRYEEGFSETEQ